MMRFHGKMARIESMLARRGFRLSRGACTSAKHGALPTLDVDRPDTPEWNGVWDIVDRAVESEYRTSANLALRATREWRKRAKSLGG